MAVTSDKSVQEFCDVVKADAKCSSFPELATREEADDLGVDQGNCMQGIKRTAEHMKGQVPKVKRHTTSCKGEDAKHGEEKEEEGEEELEELEEEQEQEGDEGEEIELTIRMVSGDSLAKLKISNQSSVADLKSSLKKHISSGKVVQALLKGDTVLQDHTSLAANGLTTGAEINAIICRKPILFVSDLSDDMELFGSDHEGDVDVDDPRPLSEAPEVARGLAEAMMAAAPPDCLEGLVAGCATSDWPGRVVVIANPGDDAKSACFQALGAPNEDDIRESRRMFGGKEVTPWHCVEFSSEDWNKHLTCGFNSSDEDDEGSEEVRAVTNIMGEKLDKHFTFGYSDDVMVAPMLYGGYASDGNIVGVLSCRTWT